MSRVVLKIGYTEYLLPNDTGVQQILRTLSKSLEGTYRSWEEPPRFEVRKGAPTLEMTIVADDAVIRHGESGPTAPVKDIVFPDEKPALRSPSPRRPAIRGKGVPRLTVEPLPLPLFPPRRNGNGGAT